MSETQPSNVESLKPEVIVESVVEKTEKLTPKKMFYHTPSGIKTIEGFAGWVKLLCILGFIGSSIYILYGIITLFAAFFAPALILLSLVMFGIAAGVIYLAILLWKSASKVASLTQLDSQSEYNTITLGTLDTFRKVIKFYFIGLLGVIVTTIIAVIVLIGSAAATFGKDFDKYNSSPLESQKSLKKQQNLRDILNTPDYEIDPNQ
jgi:hypothetical protein